MKKHSAHRAKNRDYTGERDPLAGIMGKAWWENLGGYEPASAKAKNKKYSGQLRGGKRT